MTAFTQAQEQVTVNFPWKVLILLALLGTAVGSILLGNHATERHGYEAELIRKCMQETGPLETWQHDDDDSIVIFCVELPPCGKIGIMIAQIFPSLVTGCDYRERTSFVPRNGSPEAVEDYLQQFAQPID